MNFACRMPGTYQRLIDGISLIGLQSLQTGVQYGGGSDPIPFWPPADPALTTTSACEGFVIVRQTVKSGVYEGIQRARRAATATRRPWPRDSRPHRCAQLPYPRRLFPFWCIHVRCPAAASGRPGERESASVPIGRLHRRCKHRARHEAGSLRLQVRQSLPEGSSGHWSSWLNHF